MTDIPRNPHDRAKDALLAIQKLKARIEKLEHERSAPIAVVGLSCRFPGAPDAASFWRLLRDGVDAIREVPRDRWDLDQFYDADPDLPGKMYTRYGGFLDQIGHFDAHFFGISPREATSLDPQQRLLLEVTWEALEDAGMPAGLLRGSRTGVYVGISTSDYAGVLARTGIAAIDAYFGSGTAHSTAVGRISYVLGLQGPSVALDTACSSSLVALHQACQGLRAGECDLALSGGVNAMLTPEPTVYFSKARMLSPDGRCKTFDAAADGYVRGEGCGMLVLKRLADARQAGDRILAVILGSAVNQDGRSGGLTVPNRRAQERVIRDALEMGTVDPSSVGYLEAHGTGTPLGDPIEVQAAAAVLAQNRDRDQPLLIGSVKTNIGHLEAAAGVAGVIKVILALQHGEIPAHLHFRQPNAYIPWDRLSMKVVQQRMPWPPVGGRRIAGISAFAFSGTNAHVVLEEAAHPSPLESMGTNGSVTPAGPLPDRPACVLTVSARSEPPLRELARRYASWLDDHPEVDLADFCFTANAGRTHFEHRAALVADSVGQAREWLKALSDGAVPGIGKGVASTRPHVAFLFPGEGSQYAGMARQLYAAEPTFREEMDHCAELMRPHLQRSLLEVLWEDGAALDQTGYAQPALFSLEVSLAALWRSWGILPDVLVGHGVGEFAAACVAGVFSLEDGLRLIAERARLMQELAPVGAMATVLADSARLEKRLADRPDLSIAAFNGSTTVVSGPVASLELFLAALAADGVQTQRLFTSHAFHSVLVEPILDRFEVSARTVTHHPVERTLISGLSGMPLEGTRTLDAGYWRRQARQPVQFARSVKTLAELGCTVLVEIGPEPMLLDMAGQCWPSNMPGPAMVPSLCRGRCDSLQLCEAVATLYAHGLTLDFVGFDRPWSRRKLSLPTYPFQRERYWVDNEVASPTAVDGRDRFYEVEWRERKPADALASGGGERQTSAFEEGVWLLFSDGSPLAAGLLSQFARRNQRCLRIEPGESYARISDDSYRLPTDDAGALERLLTESLPTNQPLQGIIHMWGLDAADGDELTLERLEAETRRNCDSVLQLVHSLVRRQWQPSAGLWLLTRGAQAAQAGRPLSVAQSTLWGLGRVVTLEHPELSCRLLDLDPAGDPDEIEFLLKELSESHVENQLARRAGATRVPRLVRCLLDQPHEPLTLECDATYLITGGLGALGLAVARLMTQRGARHLVLLGRRPSATANEIVDELRGGGADIRVIAGDVTSAADLQGVLLTMATTMPALRGIVHAAGVTDDGILLQQNWERFARVLAPKVLGAWNLHEQTKHLPLEFFILFSSAAALFGSPGLGNYVAANTFLDGLAFLRRAQGLPALSINWGPWAGLGMAATAEGTQRRRGAGISEVPADQALTALEQLFRSDRSQVGVMAIDWAVLARQFADRPAPPILESLMPAATRILPRALGRRSELRKRLDEATPTQREALLHAHLVEEVTRVLRLESTHTPDPRQGFIDMGMDSLMAVELRDRLQNDLGLERPLTPAALFNYPTIEGLAHYLAELLSEPQGFRERATSAHERVKRSDAEPIAIVGLSCRFPHAASPQAFWQLLIDGVDPVGEIPADRWDIDAYYDPDPGAPGKMYTRLGAFLEQVDRFDAAFFGIAPREAESMDVQQRLLLEVSWEAFENAGMAADRLQGSPTGVFIGISGSDYVQLASKRGDRAVDAYLGTGTSPSAAAGRLSYLFGLHGPCVALDTACSSSLVAVHYARRALQAGECDLALAGGVNVNLAPERVIAECQARMLSVDGRCKTFDASADGFGRGEGCGVVVLKRLSDAQRDGDPIVAVIKGSAVNQDGRTGGLTVPNGRAQERVVREALDSAGVQPSAIQYVEAHGTGTILGDPIEVQALAAALGDGRPADRPLWIGTVKTNVGHLEAAAGIAGLIKVALALQHQELPANLHFRKPNPHIPWDELPVKVVHERTPWTSASGCRHAGVSSFGFSGTNAHVIVADAPEALPAATTTKVPVTVPTERPQHLLALSAKNEPALREQAAAYASWLEAHAEAGLADICFTANVGRSHFDQRAALVASSLEEARTQLLALAAGQGSESRMDADRVKATVAFLFTGQAAQYAGMARELFEVQPIFRAALERCCALFNDRLERPLLEAFWEREELLQQTGYTQPALFALEVALAELWRSWGIEPSVVLGHSVGEYAAAYVAGVFSLEDGTRLIAERARLMQALPAVGGMAAVFANAEHVRQALDGQPELSIAADNGAHTVISGPSSTLNEVVNRLAAEGIAAQMLETSRAFHSAQMEPMLAEFETSARKFDYRPARIPLICNRTGLALEADQRMDASYWRVHARQPVLFARGVRTLATMGVNLLVEIGPAPVLLSMAERCWPAGAARPVMVPSLQRGRSDSQQMVDGLARLYTSGLLPNFRAFDQPWPRRTLSLPTYPFQRQRYWLETTSPKTVNVRDPLAEYVYDVQWQPAVPSSGARSIGTWLILSDRGNVGATLAALLQREQQPCRLVSALSLADQGPQAVADLLSEFGPSDLGSVIHLGSLDVPREPTTATLQTAERLALANVLHLAQALARRTPAARLWLVTRGSQAITTDADVAPAQSSLWGLGKVIGLEQPNHWGGMIDLPEDVDEDAAATALWEALCANDGEDQVAVRDSRRYVARLRRRALPARRVPLQLRDDGTYMITGGLGTLGLRLARWLIERGARRLVLLSRRGLPTRASPDTGDEESQRRLQTVQQLEELGATVQVLAVDVSDRAALEAAWPRLTPGAPLRGVIHAAGVPAYAPLTALSAEALHSVLAAKVAGGWHIHALTANEPLDFFVGISSVASVWGSQGQAHYAAANAFLDGLVRYRRARGLPGLSINFGPWSDGGMASEKVRSLLARVGLRALSPSLNLQALEALLAIDEPQATVADVDWPTFRAVVSARRERPLLAEMAGTPSPRSPIPGETSALLRQLERTTATARREILADHVAGLLGKVLKLEPSHVDRREGFFNLGMDSLMAVEFKQSLEQSLGQELPVTMAMDRPNVLAVVDYLLGDVLKLQDEPMQVAPTLRETGAYEPIAIVGLSCRVPGAANATEFWELLQAGVDAIKEVPAERWDVAAFYDPNPETPGKMYTRFGGFIEGIDRFDAGFFRISPREAESMEPQQRLLLELSWEALEHARLSPERLRGTRAGVYVGVGANEYSQLAGTRGVDRLDAYSAVGNALNVVAGRVAYVLGLQGPAMAVDTACSSSLVALHQACLGLRADDCDLALAGGVNVVLSPHGMIAISRARMLAADGRCKTFDASADGYVRGEGCGVVVLKRLADALRDGDEVLALIQSTAVNQDGASSGLTVPSVMAQQALLRRATALARIEPNAVQYVEAHGTGTALGDPIEVQALGAVFGAERPRDRPLLIGSVKTNIGHLEAAAGIAGLIKVVLALQHDEIPPHLHFHTPNPHIPWDRLALKVASERVPWPRGVVRRIAGVSSFGFSGTNAHVLLEEAPPVAVPQSETDGTASLPERSMHLLALSARSPAALRELAECHARCLEPLSDVVFADLCYTANVCRSHFEYRLAIVTASRQQTGTRLAAFAHGQEAADVRQGEARGRPRFALLFLARGGLPARLIRELNDTQPAFRAVLERCSQVVKQRWPQPFLELVMEEDASRHPVYAEPIWYALQVAMAELWQNWGMAPDVVLGFGVGEYAAVCRAGLLTVEEGLELVLARRAPSEPVFSTKAVMDGTLGAIAPVDSLLPQRSAERALICRLTGAIVEPGQTVSADNWMLWGQQLSDAASCMKSLATLDCGVQVHVGSDPEWVALQEQSWPTEVAAPTVVPLVQAGSLVAALADLYVRGVTPDFAAFDKPWPRRKVALPTYPFQRQRYWLDASPDHAPVETPSDWLYEVAWRPVPRTPNGQVSNVPRARANWIILADSTGTGQRLAERLCGRGDRCQLVFPGAHFEICGDSQFRIDATRVEDFQRLFDEGADAERPGYDGVIHLWSLDAPTPSPDREALEVAVELGCRSTLFLLQAMLQAQHSSAIRLWLVSRGLQPVGNLLGSAALAAAPLWGLGQVAALEHPEAWGGLIDLDPAATAEANATAIVEQIDASDAEDRVALRGAQRYVPRLVRSRSEDAAIAFGGLRADASYLITGGLGGIGLHVARWLIDRGARHLVLVGRRAADGPSAAAVTRLQESAEVTVARLDVAREEQVSLLLEQISRSMPPLRGIIHAAGITDDKTLLLHDWDRFARVLAPKVSGGWNLHALTRDLPLDFFVLCSSTTSILSPPGSSNYAAANAFLDALAHHRRHLGLPALAINWGPWDETGMTKALGARHIDQWRTIGVRPLKPAQGLDALARLLQGSAVQTAVLPIDWSTYGEHIPAGTEVHLLSELASEISPLLRRDVNQSARTAADSEQSRILIDRILKASPDERSQVLQNHLRWRVAELLKMEEAALPGTGHLLEFGLDSLMVMEFLNRLKQDLQLPLYPREIYARPTLEALARYLADEVVRAHDRGGAPEAVPTTDVAAPVIELQPTDRSRHQPGVNSRRNPGMVFVLCSPRSGSTLLRVMLQGHPALLAPPELYLLSFQTMAQREQTLRRSYLGEGLQHAVMELKGLDAQQSQHLLDEWIEQDLPVQEVYRMLQEFAGGRLLVDKTPAYASSLDTLLRAEELFDGARYIGLVRHPYAVIESFVRMRMDKLLDTGNADPYLLAEQIWTANHGNILRFQQSVDPERCHLVRYEDLVKEPAAVMTRVCEFLGIPFHPAVLTPYEGNRMTGGVHAQSLGISDPNFLEHHRIDPELGDVWKRIELRKPLGSAARGIAAELGYELPRELRTQAASPVGAVHGGMRERFVELRGLRVCVCSWGPEEGPKVVCLHGILEQGAIWEPVAVRLAALGYCVIAPDLRGHGLTAHAGRSESYHPIDFVADVDALIQNLGLEKIILVGHSLGAVVAGMFAAIRNAALDALVLVELPRIESENASDLVDQLAAQIDYLASAAEHPVLPDRPAAALRLRKATPALSDDWALRLAERITEPCPGGVRWRWDARLRSRAGFTLPGMDQERFCELLRRVRVPLTMVYGVRSGLGNTGSTAGIQRALPEAHWVRLPGGHHLNVETPDALARVIAGAGVALRPQLGE